MMRVLLFGYFTKEMGGKGTGGVATYIRDLALGLKDAGHEVAVWGENARFWRRKWKGITLYGAPNKYLLPLYWLRNPTLRIDREWFWKTGGDSVLRDFKPYVVHSHSPHHVMTPHLKSDEVPLVITFPSIHFYKFAPNERLKRRAYETYRASIDRADYVLFLSDKIREEVQTLFHIPKPTKVIYPLIDTSRFHPMPREEAREALGLPKGEVLVGFAGLLTGRKGEDLLIEASRGKEWVVVFAGGGPGIDKAKEMCEEVGCRAVFLGDLDSEGMLRFYNAIDVFVLPSRSETFGIVVIEAMACGRTVVVSREVPEEAAPEGLSYRVGLTPEEVREGVEKALSSPFPPDRLIAYAKRFSDPHRFVGEHLKVYSEVLRRR